MIKKYYHQDWIGKWYKIARENGGNTIASLGYKNLQTGEVTWNHFFHEKQDGLGGLFRWWKEENIAEIAPPEMKKIDRPKLWQIPYYFYQGLFAAKASQVSWKEIHDRPAPSPDETKFLELNPEEYSQVKQNSKNSGVGLNAFLLSHLNRILLRELGDEDISGHWLFPVNMRGGVKKADMYGNLSSAVMIKANRQSKSKEIHQQIKSNLKKKQHWSFWYTYHIGLLIGEKKMRDVSKKSLKKSFYLGTFSNMGEWSSEKLGLNLPEPRIYLCAAPGTPNYPLTCSLISFDGYLTMTLKVHPSICPDQNRIHEFIREFKKSILSA